MKTQNSNSNSNSDDWLNDKEYAVLCELFHEFNAAFVWLPEYIKTAYYARLYSKTNQNERGL